MTLNGKKVPALGYLVKDVSAPSSPPRDLAVETITSTGATLTWSAGSRPAEEYRIYRVMENATRPYAFVGAVSGTKNRFELNDLAGDVSYTFVARGYTNGVESVDSSSISFTTPKENGTNYVQVGAVADQTVRPGEDAVFSATVLKSDPNTTLTMQWQERNPGSPAWKDVRNATSSILTVRDAAAAMNGTQYRLMVTAYILAESSAMYYYSNTATLTIGALPTSVSDVTVTDADGGKGTQSEPYYGGADWTERTTATQQQSVQKTASFEKDGVQGTVYQAGENGPYVGVIESKTTQGGTTITETQYYQLTTGPDSSKPYTVTGEALSPAYTAFNGKTEVEGFTAALAEGQLSKEVTAGETSTVYFTVAHWDGSTAKPTFYWESGGKYFNDDGGAVGTEAELKESDKPQYSVFHRSKNDEEIVLFGKKDDKECFFLLKKSADTDPYTMTEVDPAEKLLIDDDAYPLSSLMPVSYSETVEVSVDTYKQRSGSKLKLTAEVTSGNGKKLANKPAAFVITDTATGESFSIAVTTDTNGTMTMEWTAPTQGVYTIHAAVTADGGYAASSSKTPVYYAALGKDTEGKNTTLYRLLLTENGKALGASVEYGANLKLQTQKWGDAAWTPANETVSYQAAAPGAAAADIGTGYFPQTAGQYTFSAKDSNGGKLASAVLTVTPRGLTIRPVWDNAPTALQDIGLDFEGALESDKAALTNSLTVSDINEYFSSSGRTGVFTFAPQWKESEDSRRLQSAYSVTLQTNSLRREADAAPVYYQVAATGHGTIFGSYGSNLTNFSSGQNRKQGEPLVFQANPETGYQVSRWLVNGTEVREGSPYRIGATTGSATQTLSIDAFSIARDAKDGQLKVEVEFANQFSVIRYSAGENGSVTARTGGGSTIANNAKVTYGSSVTFTTVPQSGYMVEKWMVNGTDYTWPGAGKPYREEELTLSGLDQTEYTVTVSFVTKKTFTAAEPTLTDGQENPVSAGTVAITRARTGETVAAGSVLPQGTALTYTVTFTDTSFNTVNRWEYSTDGEIWKEGGSGGSFTLYDTAFGSDSAALYVRAVVAVANTHRLSWKILGLAAEDGDEATLTASSNGTKLTSGGSYAANTPVDFTLTLDGSYDLVSWSENVTPAAGGRSAKLKLAADTEVTVTVAKKPVVMIERTTNGTIEVGGTKNSKPVTITSTDYVDPGTNLTVTIKPDTGYVVNNPDEAWTAVDNSDNHTYTILNVRADQTLSADFEALDKYAISYSVAAVGGSDNGTLTANTVRKNMAAYRYDLSSGAEVYEGPDLTFTAAPDNGYRVREWRVNGEVYQESGAAFIGTQLVLRGVDEEKTVMVQFMPLGDRITASAGEHGRINGAMAGVTEQVGNIASGFTLAEGASVTFTAEPDTGYEVEQWSVNGTPVSGEMASTYTYTAGSAGAVITVAFRPVEYIVSWTAEHGTVTADGYSGSAASIRGGTQVTFTAAPHNGYVFDHWTIDGETHTNETATLRWTVPTGQEATMEYAIEAVFTENTTTYSVTYDASGGGTITAEGHEASPATVTYGQSITFTAVPAEYGYVKEWRVDGVPVPNSSNKTSYTLENVTQAHTVTVVFATAVRYDVSYAVNGGGGTLRAAADGTELALPAGRQASVAVGDSRLVFAAVPSIGMMTGRWTVNGTAVTRENMSSLGVTMDHCLSNTLTIESLSRNVEVKVAFAEYSGFSIPTGGPGYEISDVKRLPADTPPDTKIRAGGDVTFTVRPAAEYSDFSKLTVNGYDCLTGSGKAADCETVSARKNADGSYTVTLTGVTGNISADIAAHKLVIGELTVPQVLESHLDLDTAEKIKLRLESMITGTAENRAFYDIALRYKNAEGKWIEVDEANFPTGGVEVVLPYPNGTDSKDTFTIVHMLTTVARAGELELVSHTKQADGLHFRVTSLSPFGVSWVKYAAPSGGGSGGSGGSGGGIFNPAYNIMVERTMNGSITVSPSSAAKGSTVTIMVYPDRGYELEMLMVMDKKGSELDLRKWGGEYSFIMPAGDVTVRARFVEEAPTQSFADVSTDAYYYEAVKWAAKNGITGGVGNGLFAPDAPCTRAQIVTFLWRAAGSPEPKNASSFSDVPASAYYARSVAWAVENGITTGTGNGGFSPDATCTRAQSVTFLYRALSARAEGTAEFRDVPKNAYYADAVAWAAANGITTGIGGGLFGPDNDCTRAQIVTFLFRTYNK
ncbi:MAG: InlB B-repeat-containing protein [Oscillospiraceae bacterium]